MTSHGRLLAVSDLHVSARDNARIVDSLRPESDDDWLLVAGDVGDHFTDVEWGLGVLATQFRRVIWAPGNHELWTPPDDPVQLRGVERYNELVEVCRSLGVITPEDPYPVWEGPGGPVTVAPLFLLYDYTFRPPETSKEQAVAAARAAGGVGRDEQFLHPDPYLTVEDWCRDRLALTEKRLTERGPTLPAVLVNHFPLLQEPTRLLERPELAPWCGTRHTADWHMRFNAAAVVHGHLHQPHNTTYDGVRFEEVSLGYPAEWRPRSVDAPDPVRQILPPRIPAPTEHLSR